MNLGNNIHVMTCIAIVDNSMYNSAEFIKKEASYENFEPLNLK